MLHRPVAPRCTGARHSRTHDGKDRSPRSAHACSWKTSSDRKIDGRTYLALARKRIEMLFAHLKRILKLDRLRLRGPNGAHDEFILAVTAQNLRKMAKLIPMQIPKPA
ncbi:transposase [Bradyrhizobium sp. BWA-3-5]|uniref:transposase n=1 Tax=Bradyrhizobium sp. BWA-3-5 TaxID=3080013 RepID=UPI00293E7700|nr:transposase [Bradyrhizobium sp. BWA-3-5]WOH69909.1 transposase [Bradyrhizobium sp. BWA-3-5]